MTIRILDIAEVTKPIASPIRNAYIDFSKMTTSLVAVVTNVERDGKPRRRLRLQLQRPLRPGRADPRTIPAAPSRSRARTRCWIRRGDNLDPGQMLGGDDAEREARRAWRALGRRRHHRHGDLGCGGQDRRQAAVPPARRAGGPHRRSESLRLCGGRLLLSGQGSRHAARRNGAAMSSAATRSSR